MIASTSALQRLRRDIVLMSACLSIVPALIVVAAGYFSLQTACSEATVDVLRKMSQNLKRALVIFLDDQLAQLIAIANTHSMSALMDEQYLGTVFDLVKSRSNSLVDLGLIDEKGVHVAYVGPYYRELKVVNYAQEDWFQAVMENGICVSDVFLGFRKVPHVIIAVSRREGNVIWILRATINTMLIDNLVGDAYLGRKGDAFIVNKGGILQTYSRFHGSVLERVAFLDADFKSESQLVKLSEGGVEANFVIAALENPKWAVVVSGESLAHSEPFQRALFWVWFGLIFGVTVATVAILFVTRARLINYAGEELEKAKAEELIIQSNKMAALGKMAAGVAHEINNPLQIISEQAGWLKDLFREEEAVSKESIHELKDSTAKIEKAVERCRSITHRLLAFGRRMEPAEDLVFVNDALRELLALLEGEAKQRGIQITYDFDEALPVIMTDKKQLQQAFLNLLDNALEAVESNGTVSVRTRLLRDTGNRIEVTISDTGPGIPKELHRQIFDPFFTTRGSRGAVGLGLSVVYRILENLGGTVRVESEIGQGAAFIIELPAK